MKKDPMDLFELWLTDAQSAGILEPNAMCLSTCVNNKPSSRMVLLQYYDKKGFCFFTNYISRKGREVEANPNVALIFYWDKLFRTVRIEGTVERTESSLNDEYFQKRPKDSQIDAWASEQSATVVSREKLDEKASLWHNKYLPPDTNPDEVVIPRPPDWGGYRVVPLYMEFWKGRMSRLHDRIAFSRSDASSLWSASRLQP